MRRIVDLSMPVHNDMITFPRVPPPALCVYESPPPFVLIGSLPPGVERPSAKKSTPSPRLARPSASSISGGPEVKAS